MATKSVPAGAVVFRCGHAFHLFEVSYHDDVPQVHFHFLTEEDEYKEQGFGKVELCCHGCGESVIVLYSDNTRTRANFKLRDSFLEKHRHCPNIGFETWCPNHRSSFQQVDLRKGTAPGSRRTPPKTLKPKCTVNRKRAAAA